MPSNKQGLSSEIQSVYRSQRIATPKHSPSHSTTTAPRNTPCLASPQAVNTTITNINTYPNLELLTPLYDNLPSFSYIHLSTYPHYPIHPTPFIQSHKHIDHEYPQIQKPQKPHPQHPIKHPQLPPAHTLMQEPTMMIMILDAHLALPAMGHPPVCVHIALGA